MIRPDHSRATSPNAPPTKIPPARRRLSTRRPSPPFCLILVLNMCTSVVYWARRQSAAYALSADNVNVKVTLSASRFLRASCVPQQNRERDEIYDALWGRGAGFLSSQYPAMLLTSDYRARNSGESGRNRPSTHGNPGTGGARAGAAGKD